MMNPLLLVSSIWIEKILNQPLYFSMRRHLKPNIISWNKDESFEGLLVDFLKSLLNDFYPETKIITSAQDWLIEQLRLKKGPFVIRHAKDLRKIAGREGVIKPRYYFSSDFGQRGIGFDLQEMNK